MMTLSSTHTYNRKDMAAMLSAIPLEEKRWTLDYLLNILIVPQQRNETTQKTRITIPKEVLRKARSLSVGAGYNVSPDENTHGVLADYKYINV